MRLNQYLDKVEQGRAITLSRFIKLLPYSDPLEWANVYSSRKVKEGHILEIIDQERHEALYKREATDRISAAKAGNSHGEKTSFSNMLIFNADCEKGIPFIVVSTNTGFESNCPSTKTNAVIIENIENFYLYEMFLHRIGRGDLLESSDIIFGSGNQITDKLNRPFLKRYQTIYCAHDADYGGLKIYKTLKTALPNVKWLSPSSWEPFASYFNYKPKKATHLTQAIKLARELELHELAGLMNTSRAFLEQEAFLPSSN